MSKNNSHLDDSPHKAANQNNQLSDDRDDGQRLTENPDRGSETAVERPPKTDSKNQPTTEEFGRQGMGVAPKE